MYKNSCTQDAGFNASVGQWMAQEAVKRKIGPEGREGGIILDEMAIQVRESRYSYLETLKNTTPFRINSDQHQSSLWVQHILISQQKDCMHQYFFFYRVTPPFPDYTTMWS